MRLMLLSEEKISTTELGRAGHLSGMGVFRHWKPITGCPDGHLDSPACGHFKIPHPKRKMQGDEKGKIIYTQFIIGQIKLISDS
jgi:hypothetical protein